jgi:O-antigen/teichoic acid export membrane protein
MVSWLSQLVLIFSGFVMPRLVDEKIGQIALGIWDFGWAFVGYLTLVGFGMGACFNRYIAKYRASNEIDKLNRVANSVVLVQLVIAIIVVFSTVSFYTLLPHYFMDSLGGFHHQAQLVILFLGGSLAIQMLSGSARGLLTGYHRWDIHNGLHAASSFVALLLMVAVLFFSSLGVVGMAISYFISTLVFESLRFFFVRKICLEFHFDLRLASKESCQEMLKFGIKSMLSYLPAIILLQTINIMIVSIIGPAALAIFARPIALTRHIHTFMSKFTIMLTPTTGAMEASNNFYDIRELYINTTRLSFSFSLPVLAFLFIYGDILLNFWMGPDYALWSLMMVLAAGQSLTLAQDTSIRILMGLDLHGKISLLAFAVVFAIFVFLLMVIGVADWQLTTAAMLLVVPLTLVYGFMVPIYTCRKLDLAYSAYLKHCLVMPFIYLIPYFIILSFSRISFNNASIKIALLSFFVAIIITLIIYFMYLVPKTMKQKLFLKLGLKSI